MIQYENECVGPCPMGCLGSACRNRNVPRCYCDECGAEISYDSIRWNADKNYHICEDCMPEEEDEG